MNYYEAINIEIQRLLLIKHKLEQKIKEEIMAKGIEPVTDQEVRNLCLDIHDKLVPLFKLDKSQESELYLVINEIIKTKLARVLAVNNV